LLFSKKVVFSKEDKTNNSTFASLFFEKIQFVKFDPSKDRL
jgi:hypothetical protein